MRIERSPQFETLRLRGLDMRLTRWDATAAGAAEAPILLLHGFMDTGQTFQFLVDALPQLGFIALDWRGFGGSSWPGDGYWFPDYLADLDALMERLSPGHPLRIIGHSMGGNVAMLYAGVRPERIVSLVNLEGIGLPRTDVSSTGPRLRQWLDELRGPLTMRSYAAVAELAESIRRRYPRVPPERAEFIAAAWSRPASGGRIELASDPRHRRVNPVRYRRDESEAVWRLVKCPVLMVLGEKSEHLERFRAEGDLERFRELVPQAAMAQIPAAGHMMHLEEPRAVAAAIEPFLRATGARPA
jgi:pimeloyl-ACP methyl ester carboxylesterase